MALWAVHGNGRHPSDAVDVATDERLSWPLTVGMGVQHLFALFGATVLVPRLTGLPVSTTLLASGAGTLLFLVLTRNRVPACLGASLAFVVPLGAAAERSGAGPSVLVGGIVMVGLLVTAVGVAVKALGVRLLETAMPPVVTGGVVVLVGFGMAGHSVDSFESGPTSAAVTMAVILLLALTGRGLLLRGCVLIGIGVGWLYAALSGTLPAARVAELHRASWIGPPELLTPQLHLSVAPFVVPLVIVVVAHQAGVVKAVAAASGRELDGSVGDALIGGGLATTLSGSVGGSGLIGYAENTGVLALTRVYSTAACLVAALTAMSLAFSPKLTALLDTVPLGVVGAASMVLLGTVVLIGVRIWTHARVDFTDPLNLAVVGTTLVAGAGDLTLTVGNVRLDGLVWGPLVLVLLHPMLSALAGRVRSAPDR
ncbi:uracil-xanthine permease family protein [Actinopolyspora mortivallis]|uniref:uracil-xanthine permease family protein n=1 Tax=Actinopolyspora mortivallis TaxID=33906 RepID=UPI00037B8292|nr:solute carrier family 23 protein [Actinopolyspora mortivallis]